MEFLELRQAVSEAFWHKDYAKCDELIDTFLAEAQGEEFGSALMLQASVISGARPSQAARGIALLIEALPMVKKNPGTYMDALTTMLGLCYTASDVERARVYEEEAYRLLLEHSAHLEVRARRHRLQMAMGQIAALRSDYTSAYWHFAQAAQSLTSPAVTNADRRVWDAYAQIHIAMACLRVRRYYEAQEALDAAEQVASTEAQKLFVSVWRAELLRQLERHDEASDLLSHIENSDASSFIGDVRARCYWIIALVAEDQGDLPRFHRYELLAQQEALTYGLDNLLCEIQRFRRSSL